MEMLKDFDISKFKKIKPSSDNTFDTMQEIKALKKIPLNKNFVKEYDDIEGAFKKKRKKNPCWKGYEMIGTKKKGGRTVPNCVPKKKKK